MSRTVASVIIMVAAAVIGIFIGSAMNAGETFGVLFAMIAGIACVIDAIDSKKDK